ncbi:MAG: hypothetical protein WAO08_35730, partial [Hyphomicrobiaceae bacterium]
MKPSPGYKSEKKRDLDIGVGFLFVDRPLPLAIDASEGDSGRSTLRGADQILQGQLHQTALSCACRDARWSPISGHNYRPAPRNKLEWGRNHQTPREPEGAHVTEGAVLAPKVLLVPPRFFSLAASSNSTTAANSATAESAYAANANRAGGHKPTPTP